MHTERFIKVGATMVFFFLLVVCVKGATYPHITGKEYQITSDAYDQQDPRIAAEEGRFDHIAYTNYTDTNPDIWVSMLCNSWNYCNWLPQDLYSYQLTNKIGTKKVTDIGNRNVLYIDDGSKSVMEHCIECSGSIPVKINTGNSNVDAATIDHHYGNTILNEIITWMDNRDGNWEIYASNATKDSWIWNERRITNSPDSDETPEVDSGIIVWQRCDGSSCRVYYYNWGAGTTIPMLPMQMGDQLNPDIERGNIVYEINDNGHDICFFNITTGAMTRLTLDEDQVNPHISGDYVAFEDLSSGTKHILIWHYTDNTLYDVDTGSPEPFLGGIDGRKIVYTKESSGQHDVYLYRFIPTITGIDSVAIESASSGSAEITVNLSYPVQNPVSFDYSTEDGTAGAGEDYSASSGSVTFASGETTKTITIPLIDDAASEIDKDFYVMLANPQNAVLERNKIRVYLRDDDPVITDIGTTYRITTDLGDQYDPSIAGDIIVFTDYRSSDTDVYYYDLSKNQEFPVIVAPGNQELTDVSDGRIVYTDYRTADIMLYDTSTGETRDLTRADKDAIGHPFSSVDPSISGDIVAWWDSRDGNMEIYAMDVSTNEERRITSSPAVDGKPAVHDGKIVWQRCQAGGTCDIYEYTWADDTTLQITATPEWNERNPHIHGSNIVYQSDQGSDSDIYVYNLDTGVEKRLSLSGDQANPHVWGDDVSFDDLSAGLYHIKLWNIPSNSVFAITGGSSGQYLNDIWGNRIVYTDDRNGDLDIYMTEFSFTPPVAPVPEFPSLLLPVAFITGFFVIVLFIRRTREY
jgi:beta propeller repeat protein